MKHHLRILLAAVLILSIPALLISFVMKDLSNFLLMGLRIISGGLMLGSLGLLIWAECRKDQAPEFLKRNFGRFFERGGFCFLPVLELDKKGAAVLMIYFQNRHANACEAVVHFSPIRAWFKKPPLAPLEVGIQCPGAAYGRVGAAWPVPAGWEGKTILVGVAAEARYSHGKGELLRYREGSHVKGIRAGFWDSAAAIAALAGGGMHMALTFASGCRMKWTLPVSVEGTPAGSKSSLLEILWPAYSSEEGA